MIRVPCVAIIVENNQQEILLLLREDKPDIACPNHWTLVGGRVDAGETPEMAAHREMLEEIGADAELVFWKRYDRVHPRAIVDQYIYLCQLNVPVESLILGEGQDFRFFSRHETNDLKIGFEFDIVLQDYFQNHPAN
jgi:8-oxo-dGTP diphosphatase